MLCHAPDAEAFAAALWEAFGHFAHFAMWQWQKADRPVIAAFSVAGVSFEVFGQALPVEQQHGWRHFAVEARLLRLGGAGLREAVMAARRAGAKTEPAFAEVLGLEADAYQAILDLGEKNDTGLVEVLKRRRSPGG